MGLGAQAAVADMGNGWALGQQHLAEAGHGAWAWVAGQVAQVTSGSGQQIQVAVMGPMGQVVQAVAHRARRCGPRARAAAGQCGQQAASVGHRAEVGPGGHWQ